jgi:hypothetical protein
MSDTLACPHGSLWCGRCRHNIVSFPRHDASAPSIALMGRPKYGPRKARAKLSKKSKAKLASLGGLK